MTTGNGVAGGGAGGTGTLLLRLDAPMQSWGLRARFTVRDTATEPSKSGIVGLLAAALGRSRHADPADLAALRMAVRCDRDGRIERDYHTTQNVPTTTGTGHRTAVSERFYLADAAFLVALHGDRRLIETLTAALARPRFALFLGRRAFPAPPDLLIGTASSTADHAIRTHPWLERRPLAVAQAAAHAAAGTPYQLRTVVETGPGPDTRVTYDQPISFVSSDRRFAPRHVRTGFVPLTGALLEPALAAAPDQTGRS